jgi:PAS domain S-box-containing protein
MSTAPEAFYQRCRQQQEQLGWTATEEQHLQSLAPALLPVLPSLAERLTSEVPALFPLVPLLACEFPPHQEAAEVLHAWLQELVTVAPDRSYVQRRWQLAERCLRQGQELSVLGTVLSRSRWAVLHSPALASAAPAACRAFHLRWDLEQFLLQEAYHLAHLQQVEEAARLRGEQAFQTLVEAAPCMIIIVLAADQTILYFNPFAERVTGYRSAEVVGKNLVEVLNGPELAAGLAAAAGTEFESHVRCKDGSRRWVIWNREYLEDYHGRPAHFIVGLDRTELKEVQQRAWQSERLAELGVLASGLAHEIRNPLNTIRFNLLNVQDALARPNSTEAVRQEISELMRDIAGEVDRLESRVRDFLRLARPEPARLETVELHDLVESVVRLVEGPCQAQHITLSWDCPSGLKATADPHQLKQVLLNLVLNAQQAMPQGGQLELHCRAEANRVVLAVRDSGPGIPENIRPKIFQPFFTTKKEGTGLGLSICRQLVEQMHGQIEFTTEVGQGTTFRVHLPQAVS